MGKEDLMKYYCDNYYHKTGVMTYLDNRTKMRWDTIHYSTVFKLLPNGQKDHDNTMAEMIMKKVVFL